MNVLFLDDSTERTQAFLRRYPEAVCCERADQAIAALRRGDVERWDLVCLDHDLGDETYVDSSRPDTGAEVARAIVSERPAIDLIVVHSLNRPAACRMVLDLREAGYSAHYVPFFWTRGRAA